MNNSSRAKRIARLISTAYNDDEETNVRDTLSDLMHLCNKKGYDFTEQLRIATDNFNAEVMDSSLSGKVTGGSHG